MRTVISFGGPAVFACLISLAGMVAAAEGDPAAGRAKAQTCLGCHAVPGYTNVYPSYHVPKLAGQRPEYIVSALKAYRQGDRPHPTMQANASNLSEQDMADIAAYLSGTE